MRDVVVTCWGEFGRWREVSIEEIGRLCGAVRCEARPVGETSLAVEDGEWGGCGDVGNPVGLGWYTVWRL